jgi:hypothetical protein
MRSIRVPRPISAVVVFYLAAAALSAANAACAPPPGFSETPHPLIAPSEQLVAHTEEILIDRPLSVVSDAMNKPLNQALRGSNSLPGVSGDFMLTKGPFGAPGSRHIVCLTDGGSVEEEALERERSATAAHFRYIVWNYQTPKARPIAYGVGEFRSFEVDGAHTRVTWTYSFKLKEDVFPGNLGGMGRFLFRVGFLDRDYAAMMRGVLNGYKASAEQLENRSSAHVGEETGVWGQPGFGPGSLLCSASEARRWSRCPAGPHRHDGS